MKRHHVLPGGAEPVSGGVRFRLWSPQAEAVSVAFDHGPTLAMDREAEGWYGLTTDRAGPGSLYRYEIDGVRYPDPASRYQPQDVGGPSQVVDPGEYVWKDGDWRGVRWQEVVLYELHIGTFSEAGTFEGAIPRLDHLCGLGVNAIEVMPVGEFPGRWNWGYDGVLPYAVEERYGGPTGFKQFIEACHAVGIAVILDVVYNHFGPEGNYLPAYSPSFFTEKHHTPWGAGLNFDDKGGRNVREFFIHNALFWLEEYHLDGLRLDAVHAIEDDSEPDIVVELGQRIRALFGDRPIHLILENDANRASVLGFGTAGRGPYTAQWNDDFHHTLYAVMTGKVDSYYVDYAYQPVRHFARVLSEGFAFQGELSGYRKGEPRGEISTGLPPTAFVNFLQNHDQVGNHAYGWRQNKFIGNAQMRAAAALLLLPPHIPMIWQGEEWNADQPFPFFCDFHGELAEAVQRGRVEEFGSFPEFRDPEARSRIPDPIAEETYRSAVLDWTVLRQPGHAEFLDLYRSLIDIRRREIMPLLGDQPTEGRNELRFFSGTAFAAEWRLSGASLVMVMNLCGQSLPHPALGDTGRQIFATSDPPSNELPAWFVSAGIRS